jgi:2',3'-cyclic-nucleotide 2'-phosphodiesterase (5'-nucleotidase family)
MRIYHTSDLHDHRGIAPRLRSLRQNSPGLLFDCGDSLRGSQTVYHRKEPVIAEIDDAGYDAQAIGNREFHYLFGCLRARAAQMRHPLICSNLIDLKGRDLPFSRFHTIEYAGQGQSPARVHLAAMLVTQYPAGSPWERIFGWRFLDPQTVLREYSESVPAGDALIVLSHLGLQRDRELAAANPRIDLLLGGHSHDTLFEPEVHGGVPVVHAGPYGHYVSQTDLEYDLTRARWSLASFALVPLLAAA